MGSKIKNKLYNFLSKSLGDAAFDAREQKFFQPLRILFGSFKILHGIYDAVSERIENPKKSLKSLGGPLWWLLFSHILLFSIIYIGIHHPNAIDCSPLMRYFFGKWSGAGSSVPITGVSVSIDLDNGSIYVSPYIYSEKQEDAPSYFKVDGVNETKTSDNEEQEHDQNSSSMFPLCVMVFGTLVIIIRGLLD